MNLNPFTVSNVNIRSGPSEGFEVVKRVEPGTELNVLEMKKDQNKRIWYKTSEGWINSIYTKLPNQINQNKVAAFSAEKKDFNFENVISKGKNIIESKINYSVLNNSNGSNFNDLGTQNIILARRIIGAPFQFLEHTDIRPSRGIGEPAPLGMEFTNNILTELPILSLLPGKPDYLIDTSEDKRKDVFSKLLDGIKDTANSAGKDLKDAVNSLASLEETKFFEFKSDTSTYYNYVNTMCWAMSAYLGIGKEKVPGANGITYDSYDWYSWRLSNTYGFGVSIGAENIGDAINKAMGKESADPNKMSNLKNKLDSTYGALRRSTNKISDFTNSNFQNDFFYIDFFIKPPSFSESFTNDIGDSAIAGAIDSGSRLSKELAFIATGSGALDAVKEQNMKNFLESSQTSIKNFSGEGGGDSTAIGNVLNRLIRGSAVVITGSNLVFPQIWHDSSYDRGFQVEMTLSTPYGNKESIFLEILVPLAHLLALVLPRQTTINAFTSPFLVRASCPGYFSCDMGIVKDLQITKGGPNGDCWSVDGLPTEITVSMSIQDLYNSLSMSTFAPGSFDSIGSFIKNTPYFDFLAVLCGLNVKVTQWYKQYEIIKNLITNMPKNVEDTFGRNWDEIVNNITFGISVIRK